MHTEDVPYPTVEKPCSLEHVILDIDHTLLVAECDVFEEEIIGVTLRPYLKEFLLFLFGEFSTVSIWTAGDEEYAEEIVEKHLGPLIGKNKFFFVWSGKRCTLDRALPRRGLDSREFTFEEVPYKNLSKVFGVYKELDWFNTMIVDDTKRTFMNNYGSALHIRKFYSGVKTDKCLVKVAEKLYEIKTQKLHFRDWKNREIYWDIPPKEEFVNEVLKIG